MQMRVLKIANVTEEDRFAGPQRWIPAVLERLKDLGSDQCNPSCVDSDWSWKELDERGSETRRIVLARTARTVPDRSRELIWVKGDRSWVFTRSPAVHGKTPMERASMQPYEGNALIKSCFIR